MFCWGICSTTPLGLLFTSTALVHSITCHQYGHLTLEDRPTIWIKTVLKPEMQVLDEIVQMLTEDRFRGKMVVILAGYEEQVTCIVFALYSSSDQNI